MILHDITTSKMLLFLHLCVMSSSITLVKNCYILLIRLKSTKYMYYNRFRFGQFLSEVVVFLILVARLREKNKMAAVPNVSVSSLRE